MKRVTAIKPAASFEDVDHFAFETSLFKVVPALSYREMEEYKLFKKKLTGHSSFVTGLDWS